MANCPQNNIWDLIPKGSKLCAEASATTAGGTPTADFDAEVKIKLPSGVTVVWDKIDLTADNPKCMTLDDSGGYGLLAKIFSGPSGPTAKVHVWIAAPNDCTWTNSSAGTWSYSTIAINVS